MSLENMRYSMYSIIANVNATMIHSMVIAGQLIYIVTSNCMPTFTDY